MKTLRTTLLALLFGVAAFAIFDLVDNATAASAPPPPGAIISSEAFHITRADGTKSLGRLIREQSTGTPTPDLPIKSFHFIVDAQGDDLILDRVEGAQPEGFQMAIAAGSDLKFNIPRLPLNAPEALDQFPVRTDGVTNVLMFIELYAR